jgi:FkbM family methyltransferase
MFFLKKEVKVSWLDGLEFYLQKGDAAMIGNYYFKLADPADTLFLLSFLQKEDLFVDIGANQGHYSILASHFTSSKVIAVEPLPDTCKRLLSNIELNNLTNKVELLNIGLSNKKGELYFSSHKNNMNHVVNKGTNGAVKVDVDKLDDILEINSTTILKIDVEGYESFVLEGGDDCLNNPNLSVIIIELNGSGNRFGIDEEEIHFKLLSKGFRPYEFILEEETLKELNRRNDNSFNTLYIRDVDFVQNRVTKNIHSIKERSGLFK